MKILYLGKKGHWAAEKAVEFMQSNDIDLEIHMGVRGDVFPERFGTVEFDYVLSFSSPWVIPKSVLQRAATASLNFHPGPPEYPGIGCTNFALYDEVPEYGVTCHHMHETVDSGPIVAVRRFPVFDCDSVESLTDRCYHHLFALFVDVVGGAVQGDPLPSSAESWTRAPLTRKQLNALCRVDPGMDADEVRRRVRATAFPGYPGAFVDLHGVRFQAVEDETD